MIGAVTAGIVDFVLCAPLYFYYLRRVVPFRLSEFVSQVIPSLACTLISLAAILAMKHMLYSHLFSSAVWLENLIHLAIYLFVVTASYMISFFFIDRASSIEMKQMIFKLEKA